MSRRIIFLDVDGVLNHAIWREQQEYSPQGTPEEYRGTQWIDPSAVEHLNALIEQTGAQVVLSSSWRVRGIDRMRKILETRGFRGELIDRTALPPEHDPAVFRRLAGKMAPPGYVWPRGYEIQQWLDDQVDVEGIVILDDSASMEHLMPWLVRTSLADGLCKRHVAEALRVLARPGPPRLQGDEPEAAAVLRWDIPADQLLELVRSKLTTTTSDVRLYGKASAEAEAKGEHSRETWTTLRWRGYLDALDRWWRWAQLGRAAEDLGDLAEANACFAAAVWLQPESADSVFTRTLLRRSDTLPEHLRRQYDPDFPSLPFRERHRRAWELGSDLAGLPTLLRWSCDPRPWVRAQIYRALGHLAHPAGIQVLQEGSFDPNPEARTAAIHGLAQCSDPTSYAHLRQLAQADSDPFVCESATHALQSISGHWALFGTWGQVLTSPTLVIDSARALSEAEAFYFAAELLQRFGSSHNQPRAKTLLESLARSAKLLTPSTRDYEDPPTGAPDDDGAVYPDPVQAHADLNASGARGFEARRAFRFLGIGATPTRRALAPVHIDLL